MNGCHVSPMKADLEAMRSAAGAARLYLHKVPSPVGELQLLIDPQGRVRALDFENYRPRLHALLSVHYGEYEILDADTESSVEVKLRHYFAGDLSALDDIPVATNGSDLQQRVWAALRRIPVGCTMSYGALAGSLGFGDWQAARAVGQANATNPIAIIVPCHRVIGKDGQLRGFGGGLHRKEWLLRHEKAPFRYIKGEARQQLRLEL